MSRTFIASLFLVLFGFGCSSVVQDIVAQDADVTPGATPPVIATPLEDTEVESPFLLSGFIQPTVEHYEWRLLAEDGIRVAEGDILLGEEDLNEYASYHEEIFLPLLSSSSFIVQVIGVEASDTMPVLDQRKFSVKNVGKTSVSLFFVDEGDGDTCVASGYEKRTFAKTSQIAELAVTELLKGSQKKMRTEIPDDTTLGTVVIENGVAKVNFNTANEARWSGGSCHVALIRSQIVQTLMQLDGLTDVVITVNGKTEADGILAP